MVAASAGLFAVNGAVSKVALQQSEIGAERWTQLRSTGAFAGLALALVLLAPARLRAGRRELGSIVLYGIVGFALVQWLYFVAIERLPIGIGLLFEFTAPVLVALWARLVWREPVRRRVWLALGLVLAGLALVAQVWAGRTLDGVGVAAGLAAAVALAVFWLQGERMVAGRDAVSLTCLSLGAAALFWAVLAPWWRFPFAELGVTVELPGGLGLSVPVAALALWTIVLGSMLPFTLQVGSLRHLPATTVAIVATLEPVAAAAVAWVWLGETLLAVQILGGGVVLVGILLAETSRHAR
jgi:drug/metabolite transporter (DMT)-like permease